MRHSQGFSLVEILLVVGVIGVIAIGAFLIYPKVSTAAAAKEQSENLRLIHASMSEVMHGKSLYGATIPAIVAAGIATNDQFESPWGPMTFHPTADGHGCAPATAARCNGYSLRYPSVPTDACVVLVESTAQIANKVRVQGASNHILKGSPPVGSPAGTPHVVFDPGRVPAACADGETVDVYLDMVVL